MINRQVRTHVRERAHNACEYCYLHQDDSPWAALHVEHIVPKVHGGADDIENLALACIDCNLHKGTNLTGIDPQTRLLTEIISQTPAKLGRTFPVAWSPFNGKTAIGRTTIRVLDMNSDDRVALRSS